MKVQDHDKSNCDFVSMAFQSLKKKEKQKFKNKMFA